MEEWGDWVGTGTITTHNRKYLDFYGRSSSCSSIETEGQRAMGAVSKSGNKHPEIPFHPERTYKKQWKGFGDWLGTEQLQRSIENT